MTAPNPTKETSVPQIPEVRPDNVLEVLRAIRSVLEVREGMSGDPLDQLVTYRELMVMGKLDFSAELGKIYARLPGRTGLVYMAPSSSVTPEYNPPPPVSGLTVTGALAVNIVEFDQPTYPGHSYTEIWRAGADNLGLAVRVGTTQSNLYADKLGLTDATRYYWARNVSKSGTPGPFNATAGTPGTTAQVATLDILAGAVEESRLTDALNDRIDLIDGPDTLPGSVAARILTETNARTTADAALASDITTLQASVGDNTAAIQAEATARADADTALASDITTVQASVDSNTAAIATEATARADADGALEAQYTVKVDLNGRVTGFGLASTLRDDVPFSEFVVIADRFAIVNPGSTGEVPSVPFVVGTVDGNTVVAMSSAFIQDAAITSAKIGNLAVDTAHIADAAIVDAKIANLSADKITAGTLDADRIAAGSLDATKLSVTELSAITADMGDITAGTITLDTTGHIKSGQTAYNTGSGFWLGIDAGDPKFSIGSPTGDYLRWDPTDGLKMRINTFEVDLAQTLSTLLASVWEKQDNPGADQVLFGVAWSDDLNLLVGVGGKSNGFAFTPYIVTSPQGSIWTSRTSPKNVTIFGVTWNSALSLFIAVGSGLTDSSGAGTWDTDAYIITSPDGVTWTERANPQQGVLNDVASNGTVTVAVGYKKDNTAYIVSSTNGTAWTQRTSPVAAAALATVCWSEELGLFVAMGNKGSPTPTGPYILTSPDGITWTDRSFVGNAMFQDVLWAAELGLFVAVGWWISSATDAVIFTSPDGINWTERANPRENQLYGVTWNGSALVAVGDWVAGDADSYIISSTDGVVWNERKAPDMALMRKVTWTGQSFVAVGNPVNNPAGTGFRAAIYTTPIIK